MRLSLPVGPRLVQQLSAAGVDRAVRGDAGASDHALAWIVLERCAQTAQAVRTAASYFQTAKPMPQPVPAAER